MKNFFTVSILLSSMLLMGGSSNAFIVADYILVSKHRKELTLFHQGRFIKQYKISLGKNPRGPKRFEGDNRTPEGIYHISAKNPRSEYFLSLKVSYPNAQDLAKARQLGRSPGGDIMIHGQWNSSKFWEKKLNSWFSKDWTAGCIAVSNEEIREIYGMVNVGTPIEILP